MCKLEMSERVFEVIVTLFIGALTVNVLVSGTQNNGKSTSHGL